MAHFGIDIDEPGDFIHIPFGYRSVQFWVDGTEDAPIENHDFHTLKDWFYEALAWMKSEGIQFIRERNRYVVHVSQRDAMLIKLRFG